MWSMGKDEERQDRGRDRQRETERETGESRGATPLPLQYKKEAGYPLLFTHDATTQTRLQLDTQCISMMQRQSERERETKGETKRERERERVEVGTRTGGWYTCGICCKTGSGRRATARV